MADSEHLELVVEYRSVDSLAPYVRNSRTHSPAQIDQIAASIAEFSFTNPVLLDDENGILAGHGRVLAAKQLGMTEVPCIQLGHLTPTQQRAYVLADNQIALNAGWDAELLKLELHALDDADFDIEILGFDGTQLSEAMFEDRSPPDFQEFDESIATEHECPKCHYRWSGKSA